MVSILGSWYHIKFSCEVIIWCKTARDFITNMMMHPLVNLRLYRLSLTVSVMLSVCSDFLNCMTRMLLLNIGENDHGNKQTWRFGSCAPSAWAIGQEDRDPTPERAGEDGGPQDSRSWHRQAWRNRLRSCCETGWGEPILPKSIIPITH